jgi:hypothetical protein
MEKEILYNKKRNKLVYIFDIDGTITNETEGWDYENRTPKMDTIKWIQRLFSTGKYDIILWTSRLTIDDQVTREWLKRYQVPYTELIFGKPFFDLYICDKAQNINHFLEAMGDE